MASYNFYRYLLHFLCIAGIALSVYAYFVEFMKSHEKNYVAYCDISAYMSCSKVFSSP